VKLDFLKLPSDERRLYIEQAAIQRNMSPVIMEKDFFVCWLLSILFKSEFAENLVFKGGTSLSKIFGAINRFSEDIDLSLSPTFLGLPESAANRTQAEGNEPKTQVIRKKRAFRIRVFKRPSNQVTGNSFPLPIIATNWICLYQTFCKTRVWLSN